MKDFQKLLVLCGFGLLVGAVVGVMRGVIQYKHDGYVNFVRGILASVLVAIFVSFALDSMILPDSMKAAIIGVCSYVADDILVSLMTMAAALRSDPTGFIQRWIPSIFKKESDK